MNPDLITLPANILLCGNTSCGKTHLLKKMMNQALLNWSDYTIIMSPTANISNDYNNFTQNADPNKGKVLHIFDNVSDFIDITNEIVKSQEEIAKKNKSDLSNVLLILDDCVGYGILRPGSIIDMLSTKSRHYNISIVILVQKIVACPRTFRLNTKIFILFNCSNYSELERALSEFVPKKYQKALQNKLEEIYNEDYNFILANNFARKLNNRLWKNGKINIIESIL